MDITGTVFLIVLTLNSTGDQWQWNYHKMPSMEICQECVEKAKINLPEGGDAEAAVVLYCAKDKARRQSLDQREKGE